MKAIVMLSGGLDSTVALASALEVGADCFGLAFDYGQRHVDELKAAHRVAAFYGVSLSVATVGFPRAGSLTGGGELPKGRQLDEITNEISNTYVGCRNTVFLGLAGSYAEACGAGVIYTGFNCNDARGIPVPDGRVEFVKAMELALMLGSKAGVEGRAIRIESPLIAMSKRQIVERAQELKAPIHLTRSCFEAGERPCQRCDACMIRRNAFMEARVQDPALARWNILRSSKRLAR